MSIALALIVFALGAGHARPNLWVCAPGKAPSPGFATIGSTTNCTRVRVHILARLPVL